MEACERSRFDALIAQHLRTLKLQGSSTAQPSLRGWCAASRAREIRANDVTKSPRGPVAGFGCVTACFDRCPDQLSSEDFKTYFASLIDTRSWSLVKIDRCHTPMRVVSVRLYRLDR